MGATSLCKEQRHFGKIELKGNSPFYSTNIIKAKRIAWLFFILFFCFDNVVWFDAFKIKDWYQEGNCHKHQGNADVYQHQRRLVCQKLQLHHIVVACQSPQRSHQNVVCQLNEEVLAYRIKDYDEQRHKGDLQTEDYR